jgi:hypothetical protein
VSVSAHSALLRHREKAAPPNSSIKLTAGPFVAGAEQYLHVGALAALRSRQCAVSRGSQRAEKAAAAGWPASAYRMVVRPAIHLDENDRRICAISPRRNHQKFKFRSERKRRSHIPRRRADHRKREPMSFADVFHRGRKRIGAVWGDHNLLNQRRPIYRHLKTLLLDGSI